MTKQPQNTSSHQNKSGAGEATLSLSEAMKRAAACHQSGNLQEAARLYGAILQVEPDHFDALLLLGVLEHQRNNNGEAHRLISHALDINQRSPEAFFNHARVLRAMRRHEEALASYDRALAIKPDFADALYNRGNTLQALGRYEAALASYDAALAIQPDDAEALNNRGVVLQELKRHEAALASHDRALALKPEHPEALNNRANALQALERCEEALASYDKALVIKPEYAEALNNRGNALQALHRYEEALASYERALVVRPYYAEALNNRGIVLQELRRYAEALASHDRALALRPEYAEALNNRGNALHALGRHDEALASYGSALALRPEYPEALNNRGNVLHALGRSEAALASYDAALASRPAYVEALTNRGNALQALNRHEEALASYEKALAIRPGDAEVHWNESLARLAIGDFEGGWPKYEWRWKNPNLNSPQRKSDRPLWRGEEDVAGKTVLLHAEQGFGDAIQFIRYATLVAARGATVVVACHEALRSLFETVAGVRSVSTPEQAPPDFDYHVPLLSLPLVFKTTVATIPAQVPYLFAEKMRVEAWHRRLAPHGGQTRIGLAWSGSPKFAAARTKACPVEQLKALVDAADCAFFSLQKGETAADVAKLNAGGRTVVDYTADLNTFGDTAAFICALDLVITVDTAVAHLAGALGRPVWILLPFAADWRWLLHREDSPWYPGARLFRQPTMGDWNSVIQQLAGELPRFRKH